MKKGVIAIIFISFLFINLSSVNAERYKCAGDNEFALWCDDGSNQLNQLSQPTIYVENQGQTPQNLPEQPNYLGYISLGIMLMAIGGIVYLKQKK